MAALGDVNLTHILTTHHHWDHAGGNAKMVEKFGKPLTVCGGDEERIEKLNKLVKHGEEFKVCRMTRLSNFYANLCRSATSRSSVSRRRVTQARTFAITVLTRMVRNVSSQVCPAHQDQVYRDLQATHFSLAVAVDSSRVLRNKCTTHSV